jgi:hypothetical protein
MDKKIYLLMSPFLNKDVEVFGHLRDMGLENVTLETTTHPTTLPKGYDIYVLHWSDLKNPKVDVRKLRNRNRKRKGARIIATGGKRPDLSIFDDYFSTIDFYEKMGELGDVE